MGWLINFPWQAIGRWAMAVGCLLACLSTVGQAAELVFTSPVEAVLRTPAGVARVRVKSISDKEAVVLVKNGSSKTYPLSSFSTLTAADGTFRFQPESDTFEELTSRMAVRSDVLLDGKPLQPNPALTGPVTLPPPTVAPKMEPPTAPTAPSNLGPAGTLPSLNPQPPAATPAAPSGVITICANPKCGKEVSGAAYGNRCPHCGVIWAAQTTEELMERMDQTPGGNSSETAPGFNPANPFAPAPAAGQANPFGQQAVPQPALHNGAPQVDPSLVQADQGLSLDNLPWWAKFGAFGLAIMVLFAMMGRR